MSAFRDDAPLDSAYTESQAADWLRRIRLPVSYLRYLDSPASIPKTYSSLKALFRCQITTFPYENLSVHYSQSHEVDITPAVLYHKMMGPTNNGRGGYCMEVSIFFHHMLRAMGFNVYMTAVRNRTRTDGVPAGEFQGWTHINNVVHLADDSKCSVDVGFGGDGPTSPMHMDDAATAVLNLGTQEVRLVHTQIPKQRLKEPKLWVYQYRNSADKDWNSFYCFQEVEFFLEDFEVQNLYTASRTLHRWTVIVVRFLREREPIIFPTNEDWRSPEIDEIGIGGKVMLVNNLIKINMGGKTWIEQEFHTEDGRARALKDYFGIDLTTHERHSIQGWDMSLA